MHLNPWGDYLTVPLLFDSEWYKNKDMCLLNLASLFRIQYKLNGSLEV